MTRVNTSSLLRRLPLFGVFLALAVGMVVAGCDSESPTDVESATMSGQVTNNSSSGGSSSSGSSSKRASASATSKAGVEGAVVTGAAAEANGQVSPLDGEATTDANGEFTITVEGEGATGLVRLEAEGDGGFSSSTIAQVGGQSEVSSQPMTAETDAEADVYLEAKAEDDASSHAEGVTAADVSVYVNGETAADINGGGTASSDVAAAIASSVEAESQANAEADGGIGAGALADAKASAFADLQSSLGAATSAGARAEAVAAFEDAMANLYVEAGGSEESQCENRQASTSIMIEFSAEASSDAELGLRRQAELLRAEATARAQEAIFEAQGASEATLDALVDAREQLKADIRTATSVEAIIEAKGTYETDVKTQMESTFEVSSMTITNAESEIETSLSALFSSLTDLTGLLSNTVDVALSAYDTYYTDAQASAQAAFEAELEASQAEAAAKALVYLSAMGEA